MSAAETAALRGAGTMPRGLEIGLQIKLRLRSVLSLWLRWPISGPAFRIYAPRRRWEQCGPGGASQRQTPVQRVLLANLMPSLGDTICYLPLIDLLRTERPDVEVTLLVSSRMSDLVSRHPGVHQVLSVAIAPSWMARVPTLVSYYKLWATMKAVRTLSLGHRFDLAILPRGGVEPCFSAHAVWMLNPIAFYGYSHRVEPGNINHNRGDCLMTHAATAFSERHEATRATLLLAMSGLVPGVRGLWNDRLPVAGLREIAAATEVEPLMRRLKIEPGTPFLVVSPGAGEKKREWPPAKYREICIRLLDERACQILVTGTAGETATCEQVAHGLGPGARSVAGRLSLPEMVTLLSRAEMFLGNDSGAGHIAGALGLPVFSLHVQPEGGDPAHINSPEHIRPVGPQVRVIQPKHLLAPCRDGCRADHVHCLDQVTVEQVWSVIAAALPGLRGASAVGCDVANV